ncbi:FTR1 family protein [Flavobacteriaceae bacterium F89]|uniref:FTR1 family protein n=1 Tax=Cerina litoralis TaxID=2874477 RepID=A0AAE3EVJ0_9FLAO|nr:FTR1 family protein [Cerina litoralis]MCG2460989.1 FTR1 family protein [Cerina litoralis]
MKIQAYLKQITALIFYFFFATVQITAQETDRDIQSAIHLLDYLSKDYSAAISDGEVIDEAEYTEMLEFSQKIVDLAQGIGMETKTKDSVMADIGRLRSLVLAKAPHRQVKIVAESTKWVIINATGYEVSPLIWPDQTNGKELYAQSCFQCHGPKGDGNGSMAAGLIPEPTNFLDSTSMASLSPLGAFNTIKLGVEGTSMRAFSELTDQEAWDLAFYIKSLRFQNEETEVASLQKVFDQEKARFSLKEVATLSDDELSNKIGSVPDAGKKLRALRIIAPIGHSSSLAVARDHLHQAMNSYMDGDKGAARQHALIAYLEGIEPVEVRLKANDPKFTSQLEQKMMDVRQTIEAGTSTDMVQAKISSALTTIDAAEQKMADQQLNYWLSFFLAASIMLREGLEAFLIIALILALIRNTEGAKKALPYVHGGWMAAVLVGIAGWFLSDWIIGISGQNREAMEGAISLVAVIVLVFVGFWLHDHSHTKKWKDFVEKRIGDQLRGKNMIGLGVFSFMVVFREAFESILFLQAIGLETPSGERSSIGFGVLAAFALIAVLVFIFVRFSKKIPVRQLFRYSSWVITLLAVILIGKGIHAIQEAGWLSVTGFSFFPRIDWLGIYPTTETLLAQVLLLCLLLLLYHFSNSKNRVVHVN